jgi:hypothetical protein
MLAEAGIQAKKMDPRFHGDDGVRTGFPRRIMKWS